MVGLGRFSSIIATALLLAPICSSAQFARSVSAGSEVLTLPLEHKRLQSAELTWITLGTQPVPIAAADRSQPANLIRLHDQAVLVDVGDGAAGQLAKTGLPPDAMQTVIISHLHVDHIGGLFAIIGMWVHSTAPGVLTICGPAGTAQMVDGPVAAMQPLADASAATCMPQTRTLANQVKVVEVHDAAKFLVGTIAVFAVVNTHFTYATNSLEAAKYQSLSYRYDMPRRSIVYTGDTGPSANVERLAHNVDLLVCEITVPEALIATFKRLRPDAPPALLPFVEAHMHRGHLFAEEVGMLAQRSEVEALV